MKTKRFIFDANHNLHSISFQLNKTLCQTQSGTNKTQSIFFFRVNIYKHMTLKTVYYTDGKYIKFVQFTIFVISFLSSVLCSFSLRFESWQQCYAYPIRFIYFFFKKMHRFALEMFILHFKRIIQDSTVKKNLYSHIHIFFLMIFCFVFH